MTLARLMPMASGRRLLLAFAFAGMTGCATQNVNPVDPLEPMNRVVYQFNDGFDRAIAKPIGTAYRDVVPVPIRDRVRNFFANIGDVLIGFNNVLQGKIGQGASDWARVLWNTSFGLLGMHDVATEFGYEKHNEDFGQTFGRWGAGDGAYLVLPILGSSSVRDTAGTVLDMALDPLGNTHPVADRNALILLRATGQRADLLDASRILEEAALDKYAFQRDAYLQRRRSLIFDGTPVPSSGGPRAAVLDDERAPAVEAPNDASPAPPPAVTGDIFEPKVPANYDAVLSAASASPEHESAR